jgi:hypothetical protein
MSKIFEALRSAEAARKAVLRPTRPNENSTKRHDRRRSERRESDVALRVYGRTLSGKSFYVEARAINVSIYGALLKMNASVRVGQNLMLINEGIQRQQLCQIVSTKVLENDSVEVAVKFPVPQAEFWQVPPACPKRRSPKKQRHPRMAETEMSVNV